MRSDLPAIWKNTAMLQRGPQERPVLSICVPFFKFPVTELVRRLIGQIKPPRKSVEFILADDASDDLRQMQEIRELTSEVGFPVQIAAFESNQGRSSIRRYLTEAASGTY